MLGDTCLSLQSRQDKNLRDNVKDTPVATQTTTILPRLIFACYAIANKKWRWNVVIF